MVDMGKISMLMTREVYDCINQDGWIKLKVCQHLWSSLIYVFYLSSAARLNQQAMLMIEAQRFN